MQTAQCISITDLAKRTSSIIKHAPEVGIQYVFVNNKPQAVILSMKEYEKIEQDKMVEFWTVSYSELSKDTRERYDRAKKLSREAFIDF